jgi:uncharacterized protein (TIGR00299 family) protein
MKTLFLDTFSGISGDMMLGLMVDLGVDELELKSLLKKLSLADYEIEWKKESRSGIAGSRCLIRTTAAQPHRSWHDIDAMLAAADLPHAAKELARRIFLRIGHAEAHIHDTTLDRVHFHEVGAVDSILDVVGAALGWHLLGEPEVLCASLPLTRGFIRCAHGNLPLPAPATAEILAGSPVTHDDAGQELVTPTGAAIAVEMATFSPLPDMTLSRTGYGVGGRDLPDRPNLLRGFLGDRNCESTAQHVEVLETHLDDVNPEWLGALMEDLLHQGALDVAYSPLQMKKNRPGIRITVLAPLGQGAECARRLLHESSAAGVRRQIWERFTLARESRTIDTELGAAQVKLLRDGGKLLRITPEFESCRTLSRTTGRPLPEIYRLVERAADGLFSAERNQGATPGEVQ